MADSGTTQNVGTLITTFAGDLTPLRKAVQDYTGILNNVKARTARVKVNVAPITSAAAQSIIPNAVAEAAGRNFATTLSTSISRTLRAGMLAAAMSPLLLNAAESGFQRDKWMAGFRPSQTAGQTFGADYFRQMHRDRQQIYLDAAAEQKRLESGKIPLLLNAAASRGIPRDETISGIHERLRADQGLDETGRNFRAFSYRVQRAVGDVNQFNNQLSEMSGTLVKTGAALSVVSAGIGLFAKSSIMASSDFIEWQNVFQQSYKTVFPQASVAMQKFAKDFDLSQRTAQRGVGDIGELLVGVGFSESDALKMSMRVNRMAADITSFRNITGNGMFSSGVLRSSHAMFMGMMGNSQSLKMLGVAIRQNSPEFKAQEKAIMAATGATLQQARAIAVLNEVEKQSRYAVGDYGRTWMTFSNSLRRVQERTEDLKTAFGSVLIQGLGLNWMLSGMAVGIKSVTNALNNMPTSLKIFVGLLTVSAIAIGPLVVGVGMLGFGIVGIIKGFTALKAISPVMARIFAAMGMNFRTGGIVGLFPMIASGIRIATSALGVFATKFALIFTVFAVIEKTAKKFWQEVSSWDWDKAFRTMPAFNARAYELSSRPSRNMADTELGATYSDMSKRLKGTSRFSEIGVGGIGFGLNSILPAIAETGKSIVAGINPLKSTSSVMKDYIQKQMSSGKPIDLNYLERLDKAQGVALRSYANAGGNYDELGKAIPSYKTVTEDKNATKSIARYAEGAIYGTREGVMAMNRPPSSHEKTTENLLSEIARNTRKDHSDRRNTAGIEKLELSPANF
jgi:hypothetical protein